MGAVSKWKDNRLRGFSDNILSTVSPNAHLVSAPPFILDLLKLKPKYVNKNKRLSFSVCLYL